MKKSLFLLLLTVSVFIYGSEQPAGIDSKSIKGVLDLSGSPFDSKGLIKLDGQWEFYWNQLLEPDDFNNALITDSMELLEVPGNWSNIQNYPSHGYGTLRLIVRGLQPDSTYSIDIPEMLTSFRFYIDGKKVYSNGIVGIDREKDKPQFLPGTVSFETDKGSIEIVCQISNFNHRKSGIWKSLKLGTDQIIRKNRENRLILDVFLAAVLLSVGIYHMGIYLYRREEITEMLFGITCVILFLRTITTGEVLITIMIPTFPWEIARKIEYSPFYLLAPVFMTFITTLFTGESIKILNRIFITLFSLLGVFFVFFPVRVTNNAIIAAEMLLILGILYTFIILIRALIKKRDHSLGISMAFFILAAASINDILFSQQLINTMYLTPLGFIIFIIIQSQMLSRRFATSFINVRDLSLRLKGTNESLSRFVPFQFLEYLKKKSILDVNLGDQVLENMTVLFADIRSFTSLSEVMTPEENFKFLNSFLSQVVPVIREQGGFVDKFIGDAIMALFPYPPDNAVRAAIELQEAVKRYNRNRDRAGYRAISLGIGVHTGPLMLGTIGETNRMETTVIADAVNMASRMEDLTKTYGCKIIISRELLNKLGKTSPVISRTLGEASVKGKVKPIEILEVLNKNSRHDQSRIESISSFESAVEAIKKQDYALAGKTFKEILNKDPHDTAAAYFYNLCLW